MRSKPVTQSNGIVVRKLSICKLPNVTTSPAQPLSYSSPPIQQEHSATQLSSSANPEHAVITSSPEQPPCSTQFTSQQPLFTALTLRATDPNYLLQQTFITNQLLLTVLKNQTTIMNTLNNLTILLTRGLTTLPTA